MTDNEDLFPHANGKPQGPADAEQHGLQLRRGPIRAMVQDFNPLWFTWVMNSGALAELLHNCPYRFHGIDILADILFGTALFLFVVFSIIFSARFICFKDAYREIVGSMNDLTFVSCWAISLMTLTSGVSLIVSTSSWGGYPFSIVAYIMWWFVMVWNGALLLWVFNTLIRDHDASSRRLPMSIIIPAVSVSTVGITGAVVSTYSYQLSAKLAVPVMIVSFNWTGVGILMGMILSSYLFQSLLADGWPPPDQIATMFILVGPMGQSAAALQILGAGATTYGRFADYNSGTFLTAEAAKGLDAGCVLLALLMNGLGVLWLLFGIWAMIETAWKRQLRWTPAWNAIVFPNSTLTNSILVFGIEMDSPAYRGVGVAMTIILIIVYLVNLGYTVLQVSQGKLLIVREDWRVKKQLEERKEA